MSTPSFAVAPGQDEASIIARLERLPISRLLVMARLVVGTATFFDGFNTLAIAYVLPVLVRQWSLTPAKIGMIISSGYLGQLVGAFLFSWVAERHGRLRSLTFTIMIYAIMGLACIFAWDGTSLMVFRFLQGIGTGGEVPVAGAYINEFVGAKRRGRFFLLYEVIFPVGLAFAGLAGYFLVPVFGWKVMFCIDAVPALLTIPLRWLLPESPRWLLAHGRTKDAESIIARMETDLQKRGVELPAPKPLSTKLVSRVIKPRFCDLFQGIYRGRTVMLAFLWLSAYMVNNGLVTWLPTLYRSMFHLSLKTSLGYGFITTGCGVIASVCCALYIDRVGRKRWYISAFFLSVIPLATLAILGVKSATQLLILASCAYAIIQTISFSLYLYSAELYPTRIRALGVGTGSACLRIGSSLGPFVVGTIVAGYRIHWVFVVFALMSVLGGSVCAKYAIETKGRVLEEVSPS